MPYPPPCGGLGTGEVSIVKSILCRRRGWASEEIGVTGSLTPNSKRHYVSISGDQRAFGRADGVAAGLAAAVGLKEVAEFRVVTAFERLNLDPDTLRQSGGERLGFAQGADGSTGYDKANKLWIYVKGANDPASGYGKTPDSALAFHSLFDSVPPKDVGQVTSHELGHALGRMMGTSIQGSNPFAVNMENHYRFRKSPQGPVRISH